MAAIKTLNPRGTIRARLAKRYLPDEKTGCWNWINPIPEKEYGMIFYQGTMRKAHRVMWQLDRGEIPDGLQLDHLCRNRHCINPDHLEPVTRLENLARGIRRSGNSGKQYCIRGHEFTSENTYTISDGRRSCKICRRTCLRNWREKNPNGSAA